MQLKEKDIELFELISTSGVCTLEQARQLYGGNEWYHYKRIQRLEKAGYLIKRGSHIELTTRSAEVIGETRYRFRHEESKEKHIEIANIALQLKDFEVLSNRDLRQEYGLNRKTHFKGAIVHNNLYYFFYLLDDNPTSQYITRIKTELKTLASSGIVRHSIIFAPTPTAMAKFGVEDCKQDELFVLPYPSGVTLISNHFNHPIDIDAPKTTRPFADYETEEYYITVLTLNNVARRHALSAYYQTPAKKPVLLICLESQKSFFTQQYSLAYIYA